MDLKDELANTAIQISCIDRNGKEVKRVTSTSGEVEDPEENGTTNSTNDSNSTNGGDNNGGNQNGGNGGTQNGGTSGGDNTGGGGNGGSNEGDDGYN